MVTPLVSIIIISYNSSKYILETLESAKAQSYRLLELIIADDGSQDATVELCRNWLIRNGDRFKRTVLLESDKNSGTALNSNRGLKAAQGKWIKYIAGDDILDPCCICSYLNSPELESNKLIFGKHMILENGNVREPHSSVIFSLEGFQQYKSLLKKNTIMAGTSFFLREYLDSLGGFNENYPLIEDWPLWLLILSTGEKLVQIDKTTIIYRKHPHNISMKGKNYFINIRYYKDLRRLMLNEIIPKQIAIRQFLYILKHANLIGVYDLIVFFGNKNNFLSYVLYLLYIPATFNRGLLLFSKFNYRRSINR